jgi:hypothetical protein
VSEDRSAEIARRLLADRSSAIEEVPVSTDISIPSADPSVSGKHFPMQAGLILAKGLGTVNGKSVPFAHYRKPTGYPEKTSPPESSLFRYGHIKSIYMRELRCVTEFFCGTKDARIRTRSLVLRERKWNSI